MHSVADLADERNVVLDNEDPNPTLRHDIGEDPAQRLGFASVEASGRLVQQNHVKRSGQHPCQFDQASLAGADLTHLRLKEVRDPAAKAACSTAAATNFESPRRVRN